MRLFPRDTGDMEGLGYDDDESAEEEVEARLAPCWLQRRWVVGGGIKLAWCKSAKSDEQKSGAVQARVRAGAQQREGREPREQFIVYR